MKRRGSGFALSSNMRSPPTDKVSLTGNAIDHNTQALLEFRNRANRQVREEVHDDQRNDPCLGPSSLPYIKEVLRGKHPSSISKSSKISEAIRKSDNRRAKMKQGRRLYGIVEADSPKKIKSERPSRSVDAKEKKEIERLKKLTLKMKAKVRNIRKTRKTIDKKRDMGTGGVIPMLGDMASIASSVRNLLGKAEDQKPHPSNHVRVRQSILTTNKKQEQRERRKFMKIFKQVEEETTTGAGSHSPKRKPRESGDAKLRSRSKKPKSKNIAPNTLSDALSSQPNASLHFGMEVSLCSNFFDPTLKSKKYSSSSASADEPRFLAVTHPDGHTQVLGNSKIRAGAGEYRGGIPATLDKGPTDVAVFKVVNLDNLQMNRAVKYGEPVWFVVVPGKNKNGGHWSQGSVLGAKADKGIFVPVVKLDPNKSIMFNDDGNATKVKPQGRASPSNATNANELGIPGPVCCDIDFNISGSIVSFGANADVGDMTNVEKINKIPLEIGKFTFQPACKEMREKVRQAEEKGEWVDVMNLDDVYISQDFFQLSATQGVETAVLAQGEWDHEDGEEGRASFKVKLLDSAHSMKHITTTEQMMQKAKRGIVQSKRRREGEKVMYDVDDTFSTTKSVNFRADGKIFTAAGGIVSPIRGGHEFVRDLRTRTSASIEVFEGKLIDKLEEGTGVKGRIESMMGKVERETRGGMVPLKKGESKILETRQEYFREMKVALPKLHPSPYKLKAKMLQDIETAEIIAMQEAQAEQDRNLTRKEIYDLMMEDETVPLNDVKDLLVQSTTMPSYNKLIKQDEDIKKMLKKPATASVVASIQASSSIEDIVPMSRQGRSRRGLRVPEVDVMRDDASVGSSEISKSPGASPSASPVMWSGEEVFKSINLADAGGPGSGNGSGKMNRRISMQRISAERKEKLEEMKRTAEARKHFGEEWAGEGMEEYHQEWKEKYARDKFKDTLKIVDENILKDLTHVENEVEKTAINGIVKTINREIAEHNKEMLVEAMKRNEELSKDTVKEARTLNMMSKGGNDGAQESSRTTLRLFGEVHKKMIQEQSGVILVKYVKRWLDKTEKSRHEKRMKAEIEREKWERDNYGGVNLFHSDKEWGEVEEVKVVEEEVKVMKEEVKVMVMEEEVNEEEQRLGKLVEQGKEEEEEEGGETGLTVTITTTPDDWSGTKVSVTHIDGIVVSESGAQLRIASQLSSKPTVQLPKGTVVKILETGRDDVNRGKRRVFVEATIMAQPNVEEIQTEPTEAELRQDEGAEDDEEEEEEGEEGSGRKKTEEPGPSTDFDPESLVPVTVKGWASLREAGNMYDRDIISLVTTPACKTPMKALGGLPKAISGGCPQELRCKVVGEGGCIVREGPLLDSRFVKNLKEGTIVIVKNVKWHGDGLKLANRRVYVETMPVKVEKGYAYLKPYNMEVMQPLTVGGIKDRTFTPGTSKRVNDEDQLIYKGWASLTSNWGYPILQPCSEHLEDYFEEGVKERKREEKESMERVRRGEKKRKKLEVERKWEEKTKEKIGGAEERGEGRSDVEEDGEAGME